MLEGVGVDLAAFQRLVGLRVVVEHDSLDRQAALVGLLRDDTPDVLVLAGDDADLDDLLSSATAGWGPARAASVTAEAKSAARPVRRVINLERRLGAFGSSVMMISLEWVR